MEIFGAQFSGGGAKLVFKKKNLVKKGISEKKCAPFFWGVLASLPCCCMMSLDALEGCQKKPYKNRVFSHTLCRRNRKKKKKKKKKKQKQRNTQKMGCLENGQEVVPPFLAKKSGFSKSSKTPIFIAFPEKMGGNHFF